jgi:hypothetical protein
MKLFLKLLLLTILDFIAIWLWVKQIDPSPSAALGIIIVIPTVIIINLAIALILYFTKREHTKLFVINALISAILMNYLFMKGIDRTVNRNLEMWEFNVKDTLFMITRWKLHNTFDITENNSFTGASITILDGKTIKKDNDYYLTTDSTQYKIRNGYLFGFRNTSDSIKLKKIER